MTVEAVVATDRERNLAMLAHVIVFVGTYTSAGLASMVALIVMRLTVADESAFVRHHVLEAINFQISVFVGMVVAGLLTVTVIGAVVGIPLFFALMVASFVLPVIAALETVAKKPYRYPWTVRVVGA